MDFHPVLGHEVFRLDGADGADGTDGAFAVYEPFAVFFWYVRFFDQTPKALSAALDCFLYVLVLSLPALLFARKKKPPTVHGSAQWLTDEDELVKAKLLPKPGETGEGVFIGVTDDGKYLRHNGPEHVLAMAPTRSGKGVSLIINTLLTWPHSVVVMDIKGENWGVTAGYRHTYMRQKTLHFNPADSTGVSCRFNPLDEIRVGQTEEIKDAQNIAQILIDPEGKGAGDYWTKAGLGFLTGAILFVLYKKRMEGKGATLSDLISFFTQPDKPFDVVLTDDMQKGTHVPAGDDTLMRLYGVAGQTHPAIAEAATEMLNKADKERSGVLSTAIASLSLYRDPIIKKNTACSDFKISDLMNFDTPVSLYLVIPPSDLARLMPLVRIMITLITAKLTGKMEFKDGQSVKTYKHRLLLLLDEFPALGQLNDLEKAFAFIAGYGLKAFLIVQSINQLNKTYGNDNSIIDNCHIRIFFAPNDAKTPDTVSRMLGTKTETVINESWTGCKWLSKRNYSTSLTGRALLTPGEIALLPYEKAIVLIAGFKPILVNKNFYYSDPHFICRYKGIDAPGVSDTCIKPQAAEEAEKGDSAAPDMPGESKSPEIETVEDDFPSL